MNRNIASFTHNTRRRFAAGFAGLTSLALSGAAFAQAASPGAAIAGELSTGKADVMLVVAAAAVILGVLVLWSYVKRAR